MSTKQAQDSLEEGMVVLGSYLLVKELGKGGFGVVWKAERAGYGYVAVKFLPVSHISTDFEKRFHLEGRILAQLQHPNNVQFIAAGVDEKLRRPVLVMKYLEGRTLLQALEVSRFTWQRSLIILSQVAGALQEAHRLSVIHRDLKPANIFLQSVGGQEHAVVLDYGIATRPLDITDNVATGVGKFLGTRAYMSPEHVEGKELGASSDIFSLGLVTYEMLSGTFPFEKKALYPQCTMKPHPLHAPNLPAWVVDMVMSMLSRKPEDRPTTEDILSRLQPEYPDDPIVGIDSAQIEEQMSISSGRVTVKPGTHVDLWPEPQGAKTLARFDSFKRDGEPGDERKNLGHGSGFSEPDMGEMNSCVSVDSRPRSDGASKKGGLGMLGGV